MTKIRFMLLACFLLPACGGDDDGPKGKVDPLTTPEGLCQAWAEAACNDEVLEHCAAATRAACIAAQAEHCAEQVGEGPFLATDAKACVAAVEAAFVDAKLDYDEWLNVVRGTVGACANLNPPPVEEPGDSDPGSESNPLPAGADCDPATEICESAAYCDQVMQVCRLRAEAGDACCENDPQLVVPVCTPRPCVSTAYCSGSSGSQICVAQGGVAAECETDAECGSGLICVEAVGGKICTAVVVLGTGTPVCETLR